ncbi:MAG: flagellar FlbD family protein [Actinomycetota bacterium]
MIVLNRLNGKAVALNPDLIERVEATPDTVVTLVDEKKFLVSETLADVIALITDYRAYVIARSSDLQIADEGVPTLHVVPNEVIAAPGSLAEGDFEFEISSDEIAGFPAHKEGS